MAVDIFMKIDTVNGESEDLKHPKEIAVLSWNWGMNQSGSTHEGLGSGSGKVNVQDLTFTKYVDSATPVLMQACCNGKHYKSAQLTVRKAGGKAPVEYLKIFLYDLIISGVSTGGSASDDRFTEHVTLNFGQFEVDHTSQTGTGGEGTTIPMTWNIPANSDKLKK